jgi:hypothetical protein
MMDKYLVEVFVPAANKTYDVFIPKNVQLFEIINLIAFQAELLSEGQFKKTLDTILCYRDNGIVLDINLLVSEANIANGTRLLLI